MNDEGRNRASTKPQSSIDRAGYDSILDAALTEQRRESASSVQQGQPSAPKPRTLAVSPELLKQSWFRWACVATVLSLAVWLIIAFPEQARTISQADSELRQKYGKDYQVIEAIDGLMSPAQPFLSSEDPTFIASVKKLNTAMSASSGEQIAPFEPNDFRFKGEQLILISPVHGG